MLENKLSAMKIQNLIIGKKIFRVYVITKENERN